VPKRLPSKALGNYASHQLEDEDGDEYEHEASRLPQTMCDTAHNIR
jgi:hypothetical protein